MRQSFLLKLIPAALISVFLGCNSLLTTPPTLDDSSNIFSNSPIVEESPRVEPSTKWSVQGVDISEVDPTRKLIAFTFDDAPSRTLENIFAVFTSFNDEHPDCRASASIFFNGRLFDAQTPHLLYTASLLGFELGNHTHSHFDLTTLSQVELQSEIDKTDFLLEKADGKKRHLLRAPFGKINEFVKQQAQAPWINWTIDTLDWTGISDDEIYNTVLCQAFSGAIVLMHDGYEQTLSALKKLLPMLKENGYQIVTVSQLIKAHGRTFYNGKEYVRARKR